jgi:hypothetical protein
MRLAQSIAVALLLSGTPIVQLVQANEPVQLAQSIGGNIILQPTTTNLTVTATKGERAVQRGKVWVDLGIPYNQSAYYQGYRQDCSGFISMAWQLSRNGRPVSATTVTLPNYSKTLSSKNDLQPGDAINNRKPGNAGHVVLFVKWDDKNQGKFTAYEENGGRRKAVKTHLTLVRWGTNTWKITEYAHSATPPWYLERKK